MLPPAGLIARCARLAPCPVATAAHPTGARTPFLSGGSRAHRCSTAVRSYCVPSISATTFGESPSSAPIPGAGGDARQHQGGEGVPQAVEGDLRNDLPFGPAFVSPR